MDVLSHIEEKYIGANFGFHNLVVFFFLDVLFGTIFYFVHDARQKIKNGKMLGCTCVSSMYFELGG